MLRQSIRSSKSIALSLVLGLVAVAGVTGCSGSEGDEGDVGADPTVLNVSVTQADIDKLAPGDFFNVDLRQIDTVYRFDYSAKAIDYTRVKLLVNGADAVSLDTQVKAFESGDYGAYPKPDMHANTSAWFKLSSDPSDFGFTSSEIAEVKSKGYFYSEDAPAAPQSSPQSTDDDCIHAECVICYDPVTGEPFDWTQPGTPVCVTIEHVWCD